MRLPSDFLLEEDDEDDEEPELVLELEEADEEEEEEDEVLEDLEPEELLSSTSFPLATQAHWVEASNPFPSGSASPLIYLRAPFGVSGISLDACHISEKAGQLE